VFAVLAALALALLVGLPGTAGTPMAAGQSSGEEEPTPQTDASVPAREVTMIGADATAETWGMGQDGGASVLVRYTAGSGWSLGPGLLDFSGQPLSGFRLAQSEAYKFQGPSPLAGDMTPNGSGALVGTIPVAKGESRKVVLVREPGGSFKETAPVPAEGEAALLNPGESLFGIDRPPMIAALEESGGQAGVLVVPVNEAGSVDTGVLHWDGKSWTREPIEIPEKSSEQFEVLAMGASSPGNAWLIARLSSEYPTGSVALFRRHLGKAGETPTWQAVAPKPGGEAGEPLTVEVGEPPTVEAKPFTVPSGDQSQILTVTSEGLWIDGLRRDAQASTTMFFKPKGEAGGRVLAAWCKLPANAPAEAKACKGTLPEALPTGPSRSFAWANASTPEGLGERVITGLPDGVSLRLDGTAFTRVLALGGETGAAYGAAFSTANEGWLGKAELPVHLTREPMETRLAPWPVSFRHALLALAPQPGAPVGSLSSQALAVGDQGEVARYEPGEGWLPESLLGPGGRRETPRLRAVAWPTPTRAYAVGDEGQMWLWRGETGLWESDPATPANFRGNLLGIAFEANNPGRGYAVGQQGVLLRYGKTWTQEATCGAGVPEPCLPADVAGASFTSIAFAGSEAIVAYRKLISPDQERYEAGLIVNEGSGWHTDEGATKAMGSSVPWAVVGLPDGGAAFAASGSSEGVQVYERQSEGAEWQATPTPFPGARAPGSLALFREGGALRVITAGAAPRTYAVENEPSPPPGFPPTLIPPYPLEAESDGQVLGVLRQTATGWSDEEHELNNAKEPPGEYAHYDTAYRPDPVAAVLVDSTGSQGWAVGGVAESLPQRKLLDTADVYRYPADGTAPVGVGSAPISVEPGEATFAIGGGVQCAAPCADRARTKIGPDVWLSGAMARAEAINGVRAFLYTGPRVTTGQTAGPATLVVPYERELARYAELLKGSKPAYVAASPTDLDGSGSEGLFEEEFSGSGFPKPFGELNCAGVPGCQGAYYAFSSEGAGGTVRVIVLDDSAHEGVDATQLAWLEARLEEAKTDKQPAIVVGNADLAAQVAAGGAAGAAAKKVAEVLVDEGHREGHRASAYFFDAPEKNVKLPLEADGASIPSFGSGTLGYVSYLTEGNGEGEGEGRGFIGASGFLLAQVDVAERKEETNVAPVSAKLIPNIGELAMEAKDGTLLRRSQPALFDGLARRLRSGNRAANQSLESETSPYIPIPSNCVGTECAIGLLPEYTFSSSRPDFGDFVEPNLASGEPRAVLLGSDGKPIHDSQSGLFCAYNAGTTIVTISAGGLSYSLPVTVQPGSVRQPCGTTPLTELPSKQQAAAAPVPAPAPAPAPAGPAPASSPPPVPVPPLPVVAALPAAATRPAATPPPPPPSLVPQALSAALIPFVPLPVPTPARPTPPSGTSAVTSPVEAPQHEEESESAPESVSNQAVAYRAPEHEPSPAYILGIVLLAAFAGASLRGRPGRRGCELRVAPATLSATRAQRRMTTRRGPLR
jgi:hypothetical protein